MAIISPPDKKNSRIDKSNKNYFSQCAAAKLRETILTTDGRQMSVAQAIVERMCSVAMFAESNQDAIKAAQVLFDRTEGKPQIVKDNTVKEIPKVVIRLNDSQYDELESKANEEVEEDAEEPLVIAELDDGRTFVG